MKRAFANFQPDLNLRNPLVLDELVDILDFWMDLGIDGFRVDAIGYSLGMWKQNVSLTLFFPLKLPLVTVSYSL